MRFKYKLVSFFKKITRRRKLGRRRPTPAPPSPASSLQQPIVDVTAPVNNGSSEPINTDDSRSIVSNSSSRVEQWHSHDSFRELQAAPVNYNNVFFHSPATEQARYHSSQRYGNYVSHIPYLSFLSTGFALHRIWQKLVYQRENHPRERDTQHVSDATLEQLKAMFRASIDASQTLFGLECNRKRSCPCSTVTCGTWVNPVENSAQPSHFVADVFGLHGGSNDPAITQLLPQNSVPRPAPRVGRAPVVKPASSSHNWHRNQFHVFPRLPTVLQDMIWETAATPPTCPIRQVLYRSLHHVKTLPSAYADMALPSAAGMGPGDDLASLVFLPECGPAGILFRTTDFGLWTASRGSQRAMQRVYARAIPQDSGPWTPEMLNDPCVRAHIVRSGIRGADATTPRAVILQRSIEHMAAFAHAAVEFQKAAVHLGRLVLEDYAVAEARNSARGVNSGGNASTHRLSMGLLRSKPRKRPAWDHKMLTCNTDIADLLRELFDVDDGMLEQVAQSNGIPKIHGVLKLENAAEWPGPAIKRRRGVLRLAGQLGSGPHYDV